MLRQSNTTQDWKPDRHEIIKMQSNRGWKLMVYSKIFLKSVEGDREMEEMGVAD